ncbi:MAG: DNA internalization-related competence protein ComEC/Rec2 [Lachnospiraceae bacterium]|nr:DNA internalization-related competence protein ComEC/Rec2 [Lachnospiraceae bacterium]
MLMKRPLLWYAGAYALGEVLALQGRGLGLAVLCGLTAGTAAAGRKVSKSGQSRWIWLVLPFFFILGVIRVRGEGALPAIEGLDRKLEITGDLETVITGKVTRVERREVEGRESDRLYLSGCMIGAEETEHYQVDGVLLLFDELPAGVEEGKHITVNVRLFSMEEAGNPGQFDSRDYYRSQGIYYMAKGKACLEISGRTDYLRKWLRRLRQYFSENLLKVAGENEGGMLCAMVLGEKWAAGADTVSLYTESGIGHLLAISGLHISLVGMGVYRLLRKWLKVPYFLSALGCGGMSFLYYLLSGEGTSAGRAFFMLTVYGLGQAAGRQYDLASSAALSVFVMLLRHPFLLFQSGFLLSFGSVLSLGILYPVFCKAGFPKICRPLFPGISIQLATLPVQACFFYRFPVYSLFLNLIVLPLFTVAAFLGMAGALFGGVFPGIFSVALFPVRKILRLYGYLGEKSLNLPGAVWRIGKPEIWQILIYGCFLLLFYGYLVWRKERQVQKRQCKSRGIWQCLLGCLILLGMFLCLFPVHYSGMELTFLDVGQGDACFIRTSDGITFLIDGGSSDEKQVGEYRLEPFLDCKAVGQVDFAMVSHGDSDHLNGIRELMERERIGTLVLPGGRKEDEGIANLEEKAKEAGIPVLFLNQGERLVAGDTVFTCLWPKGSYGEEGESLDKNEASMVLWLSWRELDVLFTGDVEGKGEQGVTAYLSAIGKTSEMSADILKVPHHGSGGAGLDGFLEAVAPKYGVISCGKNNRYGHPAKETLNRLENVGCEIFRTDLCGAVTVRSDGERMRVYGYKK